MAAAFQSRQRTKPSTGETKKKKETTTSPPTTADNNGPDNVSQLNTAQSEKRTTELINNMSANKSATAAINNNINTPLLCIDAT